MGKTLIKETIHAKGVDIGIYTTDFENEFISLTDIAKYKSDDPAAVIQNWMRNRDVIEFLGLWESHHNPDFKPLEFEGFRNQAGANAFTMSPQKWINATQAIEAEKLTGDNIYKVLIYFEKLYAMMNEEERRQLMETLISEIQIYEDRQPNGQWLKSIKFRLPIIEEDMEMSLDDNKHVETVVMLIVQT